MTSRPYRACFGLAGYEGDVGARAQGLLGVNLASTDAQGLDLGARARAQMSCR